MAHHIYIPTNYKTRVDLLPHEIERGKIDDFLLRRLKAEYEGRTIKDGNVLGYIKPGSLKLVDRGRAFMVGSHFTGTLCCNVVVNFDLYTPVLNTIVEARVVKMTPIGFTAEADPLRIIVAQTTTFDQPNDMFKNIKPDLQIPIEILHYQLRTDHIYVVGRLRPFETNYAKSYEIHVGNILPVEDLDKLQPPASLKDSTTVPKQDPAYGDPTQLNEAKDNLSDPNDPDKVVYWEYYMKQYLNDYEIIGNNTYFPNNLIFTVTQMPFSRAYFKLIEILHDEEILKEFEDEAINVLLLGEAPGGFIQAMIDTHQNPNDKLTAVTAPRDLEKGVKWDWYPEGPGVPQNLKIARAYLDKQPNLIRETKDLTDPRDIIDIINSFAPPTTGSSPEEEVAYQVETEKRKMHIITSDGGIDVEENDNYNFQERMNYKLFYGEILTALGCQAVGGHYIMKIYDIYTDVTNQFIHLLANFYATVTITKPKTSRPANSERYIVCKYFRGLHNFPLNSHLEQLDTWNKEEISRNISVLEPFLERKFYITSIIIIALDPQTTALIKEKNQLYVKRQLDTIKEGTEVLEQFLNDTWNDTEKTDVVTNRMGKYQIPNALSWCTQYLLSGSCKPMPTASIVYYQTPQGPKNHKVGPLVPPDTTTRLSLSGLPRGQGTRRAIMSSSSTASGATTSTETADTGGISTSGRGRGRGSLRGSTRGTRVSRGSIRGTSSIGSRSSIDAEAKDADI